MRPARRLWASVPVWPLAAAIFLCGCGNASSPAAASRTSTSSAASTVTSVTVGVAGDAAPVLAPGSQLQLWAVAHYSDQSSADVTNTATWQSSNPSLATISRDGVLTAASEGAVDVVAALSGVSGSLHATIARAGCAASTLSPAVLTFNAFDHFQQEVKVTTPRSDCRWQATTDADWLRFNGNNRTTFDPGQSGSGSFYYQVLANNYPDSRAATVTITFADGASLVHAVAQEKPVSCSFVVTPDDGYFPSVGGVGSFDVTATPRDCRWTATTDASYYVGVRSNPSGTGSARVTYVVVPTTGNYPKEVRIFIGGLSGANPPATHKIHIAPAP